MIPKRDLRHAAALLRRWNRNNTAKTQRRLISDPDRLWMLARDLAYALQIFYERETGDYHYPQVIIEKEKRSMRAARRPEG